MKRETGLCANTVTETMTNNDKEHQGVFDFLWDTDTQEGQKMSKEMEKAVKEGEISVSFE